jgi:hypothetical protein
VCTSDEKEEDKDKEDGSRAMKSTATNKQTGKEGKEKE